MDNELRPGKYRHFKGKEYELICTATHSETMELMVVYRALYGEFGVWVRPLSMWNELVEVSGKKVPRFTYIGGEETWSNALNDLWHRGTENDWLTALAYYDDICRNAELDREMETISCDTVANMTADEFYSFLHDRYFVWKYTAKNRLATSRKQLEKYRTQNDLFALERIKAALFSGDRKDSGIMLKTASQIHGLGIAGASGLLSILFPEDYGTVDQFVILALCQILGFTWHDAVSAMKPGAITLHDGVMLEDILRGKAADLNKCFKTDFWTPRKIDKILWAFGR